MDHLHPEVRKLIEIRGWSLSSIQGLPFDVSTQYDLGLSWITWGTRDCAAYQGTGV